MNDLIFRQCGKDGYYKIWHKSEKNIFIFVESGEGSIVLREESYPLTRGTLCFIGENRYHYTFPKEPMSYVRSKLLTDSESIERLTNACCFPVELQKLFNGDCATVTVLTGDSYERAVAVFEQLSRLSDNDTLLVSKLNSAALQLMLILAENVSRTAPQSTENSQSPTKARHGSLQTVIEYINSHVSEEISIDKISESCFISKYHLCRIFKKRMGLTVMEYILETRLTMAKELLHHGEIGVTEIALTCGFCSASYFSRVFKAHYGITPSQYTKTVKKEL